MTLAYAWKDEGALYFVADAAITRLIDAPSGPTSLQQTGVFSGYAVDEAVLKLYRVANDICLVGAGMIDALNEFALNLRTALNEQESPAETCSWVREHTVNSIGADQNFQFILGYFEGGQPRLFTGSSAEQQVIETDVEILGSASRELKYSIRRNLEQSIFKDIVGHDRLLESTLHLNSLSVHEPSIFKDMIGGVFTGCLIDENGLQWHGDTLLLYVSDAAAQGFGPLPPKPISPSELMSVFSGFRDDIHFVRTEDPENEGAKARIFENSCTPAHIDWVPRWNEDVFESRNRPEIIAFIGTESRVVCVFRELRQRLVPLVISREYEALVMTPEAYSIVDWAFQSKQPDRVTRFAWIPKNKEEWLAAGFTGAAGRFVT